MNVTITRSSGYTSDVALGVDGLPAGVTGSFSPQILTGTNTASVLTLTATSSAVAGSSSLTIRATGAGISASTTSAQLTITVPSITLTAGVASVSVAQGLSNTVPITIARAGGFAGAIALTAEGLPTGVSASFVPASLPNGTTTSTLTLTPSSSALAATNTITIRATGAGVADKTTTVQLTVTVPTTADYSLTATPAALSVVAGASSSTTIAINRTGNFAPGVTLALTGNPTGVTGTFTPNPATASSSALAISTTAATVPGTYTLTISGTATGDVAAHTTTVALTVTAQSGITVALSPASLSIAAGTTGQTSVTLTRNGALTGDIALTAENLPTGVTVAFAPATVSGTASTATFTVASAATLATTTVTVRGTVGSVSGTATISLTVTAAQSISLSLAPASLSLAQGATGSTTATITRNGGFAGTVNLAVTGLPSGVTTTITPAAATGPSASLSIVVGSAVAAGTYTGTLTATSTGVANATATFTLTVTSSGGGGGGGNIIWQFCDATRIPIYFAVKDGASGAWTKVTAGANNTYTATLTQSVGGVAYVLQSGTQFTTSVFLEGTSELIANGAAECSNNPGTGKTVLGTATGFAAIESANIALGSSTTSASFSANSFTLTNVANGSLDLLAVKTALNQTTFAQEPNKLIIRRGLNPVAGSTLPVLDFGAAEAIAPATSLWTIANAGADQVNISGTFFTANGLSASLFTGLPSTSATRTVYGVPVGSLATGDLHNITVTAFSLGAVGNAFRSVITYVRDIAAPHNHAGCGAYHAHHYDVHRRRAASARARRHPGGLQQRIRRVVLTEHQQSRGDYQRNEELFRRRHQLRLGSARSERCRLLRDVGFGIRICHDLPSVRRW